MNISSIIRTSGVDIKRKGGMFFMQKLIDTLISNNLELIESGNLKSIVLDSGGFHNI